MRGHSEYVMWMLVPRSPTAPRHVVYIFVISRGKHASGVAAESWVLVFIFSVLPRRGATSTSELAKAMFGLVREDVPVVF